MLAICGQPIVVTKGSTSGDAGDASQRVRRESAGRQLELMTTATRGRQGDLADSGAEVVDERAVDDGNLITGVGVTSGIDLA